MIAQPKTKAKDAIAQIDTYMRSGEGMPDTVTSTRLRRDLMSSLAADAFEAYMGLALLETVLWHTEQAKVCFQKALQLNNAFTGHANYATCLARLGEIAEAAEQSRIAASINPVDVNAVERALHYSMIAGELQTARAWGDRLRKLIPGAEPPEAVSVDAIVSVFDKSGLHESVMAQCNCLAYALLGNHQTVVDVVTTEVDLQDQMALLTLTLNTSEKKAQDLDSMLGSLLFEHVPDYDPGRYWIGFAAKDHHDR